MSEWAKKDINTAHAIGLVNGRDNGVFTPQDRATRAESAKAIYNLFVVLSH